MRQIMGEDGPIEYAVFDGYSFGDLLLEGVKFRAWIDDDNDEIQVEPMPGNEEYLAGLNMEKWLKEAKIVAEEGETLINPETNEEAWIEGGSTPTEEKPKLTKVKILAHRTFSHDSEEYHNVVFKIEGKKRPNKANAPTSKSVPAPKRRGRRIVKKKKASKHQLKSISDLLQGK